MKNDVRKETIPSPPKNRLNASALCLESLSSDAHRFVKQVVHPFPEISCNSLSLSLLRFELPWRKCSLDRGGIFFASWTLCCYCAVTKFMSDSARVIFLSIIRRFLSC